MAFDIGSLICPASARLSGDTQPQPNEKVTNLSAHVDGGPTSVAGTNQSSSEQETRTLWLSVSIVLFAIAILWVMGSIVFKKVNL